MDIAQAGDQNVTNSIQEAYPNYDEKLDGFFHGIPGILGHRFRNYVRWHIDRLVRHLRFLSVLFFDKIKVDDPVGAISVHGVCGAWGTLAAGIFNIGGTSAKIIGVQLLGIGACFLWVFPVAFLMFKLIDKTVGLRVSPEEELEGLDFAEHGGNAYPDFEVSSYGGVGSSMGPGSPSTTGDTVGQFEPVEQT
jgi:hypothetical protein